ncbi:MAG: hypothetical protein HY328_15645 [Chloroflexi bacterium]|nr:hypothetical protein [Chloroflexota bacterium]
MIVTEGEIRDAFTDLANATRDAYRVGENLIGVTAELEAAKLAGLRDGSIDGKNAELREAAARAALADLYDGQANAEQENRECQCALTLAKLEVERVRSLLRLAEVTKGGGNE